MSLRDAEPPSDYYLTTAKTPPAFSDESWQHRTAERVKELVQSQEHPRSEPHADTINGKALMIAVGLFIAIMIVFVVFRFTFKTIPERQAIIQCVTESCTYQELLISSLQPTIGPCDDFGTYVCSSLKPLDDEFQWNLHYNPKYQWMKMKAAYLARNVFETAPMKSAADMLEVCVNRTAENENESFSQLVTFMRKRRLLWPDLLEHDGHPLDVALELCIRWQLPFWFNIRLLDKTPLTPRRILITRGAYTTFWMSHYKDLSLTGRYKTYVESYLKLFSPNSSLNMTYLQKEFQVTSDVLSAIHYAASRKRKNAAIMSLKDLDRLLPAGDGNTWTLLLNKHLNQTQRFSPNETVLVSDTEVLEVIRRLSEHHGSKVMLHQLGWWFVQYYTVVASDAAFTFKYGQKSYADMIKPMFCEVQVEESYKLALIGNHVTSVFSASERATVDAVLREVKAASIALIRESLWIDEETKSTAIKKLTGITIHLWPKRVAPSVMKAFTVRPNGTSFIATWIENHKLRASRIGSKLYYASNFLPHNYRDDALRYEYLLNHVTVAMLALEAPFYIRGASPALNYGGLGAAFARELVKAFDPEGINHTWDGSSRFWLSSYTVAPYMQKTGCKGKGLRDNIFPEVPGLEVAFRAFRDKSRNSGSSFKRPPGFSDEQMFFLQFCYVMCRENKTSVGHRCNAVLRNSEPFARAFECAPGSPMNSRDKCGFF